MPRRRLAAIPHQPDGRPSPAWAVTAAIIATVEKSGITEIIMVAVIIPVARGIVWRAVHQPLQTKIRNAVVWRLVITGQETITMPVIDVPLVGRRGEHDGRQQRQKNCT